MNLTLDSRTSIHVARQPIVEASGRVFGYELLYRGEAGDTSCTAQGDLAAARVLTDAILGLGLDTLTNGVPAFLNLTRQVLVDEAATLLSPASAVFELREDIPVDAEVIEACRRLQTQGYLMALDDFVPGSDAEALMPFATFVKVDVLSTSQTEREALARRLHPRGIRLVAERVETQEVAAEVRGAGYELVQGYYFCRPLTCSSKALPARRLAYLSLFTALNRPDLTIGDLEDLVKHDVSLSVRVLRSVNSAAFSFGHEVTSLRHALVLLGLGHVRKWASVWAMAGLNNGGTPETAAIALMRARCCELIGNAMSGPDMGAEMFMVGLCSLLDAILDRPIKEAINGLPLPAGVRDALLGHPNLNRVVLDAVISYERGEWDEAEAAMRGLKLPESLLAMVYADALRWARELNQSAQAA